MMSLTEGKKTFLCQIENTDLDRRERTCATLCPKDTIKNLCTCYKVFREFPTGRGFADLVLIPWHNVSKPAIVIELKWKQDAKTAIAQIHERHYPDSLQDYSGELILCGVSYDKQTKEHKCVIEKVES